MSRGEGGGAKEKVHCTCTAVPDTRTMTSWILPTIDLILSSGFLKLKNSDFDSAHHVQRKLWDNTMAWRCSGLQVVGSFLV